MTELRAYLTLGFLLFSLGYFPSNVFGNQSSEIEDIQSTKEFLPDLESSGASALALRRPRPSRKKKQKLDCDFYVENICLEVQNYPEKAIAFQLQKFSRTRNITNGSKELLTNRRQGDNDNHLGKQQASGADGVFLCPSEIDYVRPKRGRSVSGEWKDIVNVEDYTQTLRMERCRQPLGSCSYVSHHFKSECSQIHNYHRLLSWNKPRGLHMDIYKVPTCCSCSMKGYSYLYPPLRVAGNTGRTERRPGPFGHISEPRMDDVLSEETLKRNRFPVSSSTRSSFLRGRRENSEEDESRVNYKYHPIIGFF